jgi:hypothetical protein
MQTAHLKPVAMQFAFKIKKRARWFQPLPPFD